MKADSVNPTILANRSRYSLENFPNLKELRDYMIHGPTEFCIERARLLTSFLKERGGLDYTDPFTRQAELMTHVLKSKKANIFPNDLLAGSSTSKRKGVLFYPEFLGTAIWPELLSMSTREECPYQISIEDIMQLDQEILPFWMDKNVLELVRQKIGDNELRLWDSFFFFMPSKFNCIGHTIPDYKSVLEKGLSGLIKDAKMKLKTLDKSDKESRKKKKQFYKGIVKVMKGVMEYANNLSKEASRQAESCNEQSRKTQLEEMAVRCRGVPANPATHFKDAVQSIWICKSALYQEQNNVGFSIGRIDQLLNQYYIKDMEEGILTRDEAIEILSHFWCKIGDPIPMVPEAGELLAGGSASNQAITIGGCNQEGENVVNETTFLCLDVSELMGLRDPNVNARIRNDDPEEYTQRVAEVIINTGSTPSLINDKVVIPALEKIGVSLEDARDYAQVGCLEPTSTGRTFGHTGAILINLISALELVFNDGNTERSKNMGIKTGTLSDFKTYAYFLEAVKHQLKFIFKRSKTLVFIY